MHAKLRRWIRFSLVAGACASALWASTALAIVTTGTFSNTTPPADNPGFYNVSATPGLSQHHLLGQWLGVATAYHVYTGNGFVSVFDIADSRRELCDCQHDRRIGGSFDLKLVNLTTNPNLPSLTISSASAPVGSVVTMIGNGVSNSGSQQYWNVAVPSPSSGTWTWTAGSAGGTVNPIPSSTYFAGNNVPAGSYQASGYAYNNNLGIHWGQNVITGTGASISDGYGTQQTSWTTFNDPALRAEQSTVVTYEAQSSSREILRQNVTKNPSTNSWELTGLMYAEGSYTNQPASTARSNT